MGVYIRGMEMPRACYDCPFFESIYHLHGCHAVPKSFDDMDMWNFEGDGRPSWCPLIKIPPHGRLIDSDEFLRRAIETKCFRGDYALMLEELVGESPTIIEAEEVET